MQLDMSVFDYIRDKNRENGNTAAFINRGGSSCSFERLIRDAEIVGAELIRLGLGENPVLIMGQVGCGETIALLGALAAGCPVMLSDASLSEDEYLKLLRTYDVKTVFCGAKYRELAEALKARFDGVEVFYDVERRLLSLELRDEDDFDAELSLPTVDPSSPAFLFFTERNKTPVIVSHKSICSTLAAVSASLNLSTYTFLSPPVWKDAFDCVMGVLLPLSVGCGVVKRGEKRGIAKAISESGATALVCTPQRLCALERSLKRRRKNKQSRASIVFENFVSAVAGLTGLDLGKRMYRKIHMLMGDNFELIICGGAYPDKASIAQFIDWGFKVYDCYFLSECGAAAISRQSGGVMEPLAELRVEKPDKNGAGEIYVCGDGVPIGVFGGEQYDGKFPTGDIGIIENGEVTVLGKRKTMLCGHDGKRIFPEELEAALKRSPYVTDCVVSGRYDTKTNDIIVTASITPDYGEVNAVLGEKYSAERLEKFFDHALGKIRDELPHKIHEMRLL